MKVLMVTHYFASHRGGIELAAGHLARELAGLGHEVTWLATDATAPGETGCRTVPIAAWNFPERRLGVPFPVPGPRALHSLRGEIRRADVVIAHDGLYLTTLAAFLLARCYGKPILLVQHIGAVPYRNPLLRFLQAAGNRFVTRPLLARADRVAMVSALTERYFSSVRFRIPPVFLPNGVDAELFRPVASVDAKANLRARFGLPIRQPVALFVGRFVEKKGLHALRLLATERRDLHWAFAGWGPLDPGSWELPNVTLHRGLTAAPLADLYRASDLLVLPSVGEGYPLVVQEALACGLPVLCGADTAAADPRASPLLTGVPVDPGNPGATARAFAASLDGALAGGGLAGEAAAARHAFARAAYSWPLTASRYAALLTELLGGIGSPK